jgi:hypothetical protein
LVESASTVVCRALSIMATATCAEHGHDPVAPGSREHGYLHQL